MKIFVDELIAFKAGVHGVSKAAYPSQGQGVTFPWLVMSRKCFKTSVDIFRRWLTLLQSVVLARSWEILRHLPKQIHAMDYS